MIIAYFQTGPVRVKHCQSMTYKMHLNGFRDRQVNSNTTATGSSEKMAFLGILQEHFWLIYSSIFESVCPSVENHVFLYVIFGVMFLARPVRVIALKL